jgi:radical SAM superfamily enzyme YgiQ (UPF0313 family)
MVSANSDRPDTVTHRHPLPTRMRTLLISLNTVDTPFPVFPLGVAYLRDAVAAAGHEVELFDCLVDADDTLDELLRRFDPQLVAFSLRNVDNVRADDALSYIAGLRAGVERVRARCAAPVVFGGAGFSVFPQEIFQLTGADYGIRGEGEIALPQLLGWLEHRQGALDAIPGLLYRSADGDVCNTPPANVVPPARAPFAPDPAWVAAYRARGAVFNVQTQRGCPLHCSYCTYPLIEGAQRRLHEYARVVDEMRRWRELGVRYVFVVDSVLNTSIRHLRRLGEAILAAGVEIEWGCFLRPNGVGLDDLLLLKRAGLRHIEFGTDSFADAMLASYGKSFTFPMIATASAHAEQAGIHYCHFLILGGPGETEQTLEQTFARSQTLPGGVFFAFPGVRVYPDTPLWHGLRARGIAMPDNLLAPFFFVEPGLTVQGIAEQLTRWCCADARWAPAELPPQFGALTARFRARGVEGPLWEYVPLMARMAPA